jgi:hypothetical protein
MRTSKREVENNYRKDNTDTDTLARVKLEPPDDLLEQAYTGTDGRPTDVDNRALPAINIENIPLNPNVVISRTIPSNQSRPLLSEREIQSTRSQLLFQFTSYIHLYIPFHSLSKL